LPSVRRTFEAHLPTPRGMASGPSGSVFPPVRRAFVPAFDGAALETVRRPAIPRMSEIRRSGGRVS
jgi:hypothetical protein